MSGIFIIDWVSQTRSKICKGSFCGCRFRKQNHFFTCNIKCFLLFWYVNYSKLACECIFRQNTLASLTALINVSSLTCKWPKTSVTCVAIYTPAWTMTLLLLPRPHLSHRPQLGRTNMVSERDYLHGSWQGGSARSARSAPRWLWHLFNAGRSVFTLPDKSPMCRTGRGDPW